LGSVSVTSAQVLIAYMKAVGRPVTIQTQASRRVRQSQTVTPRSVSAASSWLLAPNRFQNIFQAGTGLPLASRLGRSRKIRGTPAVIAVPSQAPALPVRPVSSCTM